MTTTSPEAPPPTPNDRPAAPGALIETLMDSAHGVFLVMTESSRYVVDLDAMRLRRLPGIMGASGLRQDGEDLELLAVQELTVGRRGLLVVDLHLPGVPWTWRTTTIVRSIQPVETAILSDAQVEL